MRWDEAGVLDEEAGVVTALGARRQGVVAQSGELVEDERRPDQHRRLTGEVGGPRRVDVLHGARAVVLDQVGVGGDGVDTSLRVEGDLAVLDQVAAGAEGEELERLLGEHVGRVGRCGDPVHPVAVQRLGSGEDPLERVGRLQPGCFEQVGAVDEQLSPPVGGHRHGLVVLAGQRQRSLVERVRAK